MNILPTTLEIGFIKSSASWSVFSSLLLLVCYHLLFPKTGFRMPSLSHQHSCLLWFYHCSLPLSGQNLLFTNRLYKILNLSKWITFTCLFWLSKSLWYLALGTSLVWCLGWWVLFGFELHITSDLMLGDSLLKMGCVFISNGFASITFDNPNKVIKIALAIAKQHR